MSITLTCNSKNNINTKINNNDTFCTIVDVKTLIYQDYTFIQDHF